MYQDLFVPLKRQRFDDLDGLSRFLKSKSQFSTKIVQPETIRLTDNGLIKYGSNEETKMSLEGFVYMATRVFKIPDPFAKMIPFDLLQKNIERLSQEIEDNMTFIFNKEGLLVNAID